MDTTLNLPKWKWEENKHKSLGKRETQKQVKSFIHVDIKRWQTALYKMMFIM
jgi:hypothetical protein